MTSPAISPKALVPSPQQEAVFQWVRTGRGSAILVAVAGSGKTTTLVEALKLMKGSVAFAAYNKAIATEIDNKAQAAGVGKNVRVGTFHSFGFSAWRRVAPGVKVNDRKVEQIAKELVDDQGNTRVPEEYIKFAVQLVSLAKQRAIGVLANYNDAQAWLDMVYHYDLTELLTEGNLLTSQMMVDDMINRGIKYAKDLLKLSVEKDREEIDFDDMIYAPLVHNNVRVWQNDWVLVDEAQDTNPARRALAKKMLRPGGRLIAVGDPHQAIYGFTGADNDSLELIKKEFGCVELPLTVTYRCPKAVVRMAQMYVKHIQAAPTAPEGQVDVLMEEALKLKTDFHHSDAILCRNTKPLVELAFNFIRRGVPCHVEGRDIGRGLLALAGKWKVRSLDALVTRLDAYIQRETERLLAKGQEQAAEQLADKVETLKVIIAAMPAGAKVEDLRKHVEKLFGDTEAGKASPTLTLATVHKSKGREWNTVFLLGRNRYMPSKYARQQWQKDQENNLIYVAFTRAKQTLVEVPVAGPSQER